MFKINSRVAWINLFLSVHRRCLMLLVLVLLVLLLMLTLGAPVTGLTRVAVLQVTWLQN